MDWREMLRLASIFGPQGQQQEPTFPGMAGPQSPFETPPINPADSTGYDPAQRMRELYQPETQSIDRFNSMIGSYPVRQEPGKLKKIGAVGLASLADLFGQGGGQKAFGEMLYGKHNREVADWKEKIEPTERAANIERQGNVNSRTAATQTVSAELRDRQQTAKEETDAEKLIIAQQKQKLAEFKAKNPAIEFRYDGPTVIASNPLTGEVIDTGFKTQNMTDLEKITLNQSNALARIKATGDEAQETATIRGENQQQLAETRGWAIGTIPDPANPARQIGVRYNQITGEVIPIDSPITKQGTGASAAGQATNLQAIQDKTRETLGALDEILDPDGKLKPNMTTAVGASRMFGTQYIPATEGKAGDAAIKRLKSMLIVDLIGEMKAQSRTGATGFGQLNMKELAVLENAASKLDPALDEKTFTAELVRIRERLNKILQPTDGFTATTTTKTKAPVAPAGWKYVPKQGGGWTAVPDTGVK